MNKENKMMKFASIVLLVTVIALILVAGTFAKYTSSATGSATVTVAKWNIKAGKAGSEASITGSNPTITFDLFDTILDTDGSEETDVRADMIAPGTRGSFELSVKNDSEVNAEYTIELDVDNADIPLEFKVADGEWSSDLDDISATKLDMNESDTVEIQWRWAYETLDEKDDPTLGDEVDTGLGIAPEEIEVTATLTVMQVD